jgi:hypothetical protein
LISKSLQMCPKSQKKNKKFYRTFFRFCTAKKGSVRKYETLKVLYKTISVSTEPLEFHTKSSWFRTEPSRFRIFSRHLFLLYKTQKRFCKRWFCVLSKRRTFKRFCLIFYPFFETLDTFGGFWKSTEPFRRVLQSSFFFRV